MVAPSGSLEVILLNHQLLSLSSLSPSTILIIRSSIFPMITSIITLMIRRVSQVDNALQVHEEAWNAYPYCKTVLSNPGYMKVTLSLSSRSFSNVTFQDNFYIIIETYHLGDRGDKENVHELEEKKLKKREVEENYSKLQIIENHNKQTKYSNHSTT